MASEKKGPIGFVGVGKMGGPMAGRLLAAGWDVVVSDVSKEAVAAVVAKGARDGGTPEQVASMVETVLVSLPTPPIVKAVMLGPGGIASGKKRRVVVDLSTTGPSMAKDIQAELEKKGVIQIDAPVSGGVTGAEKGTLACMVSGPKAECDALEPVFKVFGKYFYIGPKPGTGQMMKLANNLLSATNMVAAMEVCIMGVKFGLDANVMIDVINASTGRNTATEDKFPRRILPRTFDHGFSMGLMTKDVNLAIEEAEKLGIPMFVGNATKGLWNLGLNKGGFDTDFTTLITHLEQWSDVQVGQAKPKPKS